MAIYKPSNCTPFSSGFDANIERDLSFQVNTNNINITGYKIKILDSENNEIFQNNVFTPLFSASKYQNSGVNGSTVILPFIKSFKSNEELSTILFELGEMINNVILYCEQGFSGGDFEYETNAYYHYSIDIKSPLTSYNITKINNFYNGYAFQPYKWIVTIAQGLDIEYVDFWGNNLPCIKSQTPSLDKYYDMQTASGKIIGTTPNRIQSYVSEYIYKDYFIQLYDGNNTPVGTRVMIDSYDYTYGYIYPQIGKFTQENINNAKYFQIYKNTNNVEYINANRIVDYITSDGVLMEDIKYKNSINISEWQLGDDQEYFYQKYNISSADIGAGNDINTLNINIPSNIFDYNASATSYLQPNSSLLLVKNENSGDEFGDINTSPFNGVFVFVSAVWARNEQDADSGVLTIKWQRPAMADSWSEFLGQSFYIKTTGENWDSNAQTYGVLNSTLLGFVLEKPIEIYPEKTNDTDKTLGKILKTNDITINGHKIVYIKPNLGIRSDDRLKYILKNGDGGFLNILDVDTETYGITVDGSVNFQPDVDSYYILSFNKSSDENPFQVHTSPIVKIDSINEQNVDSNLITIYDKRIKCHGSFVQSSNKSWKSFFWSLTDLSLNQIKNTATKYNGEISAEFVGIENNKRYLLLLQVEDEFSNVYTDEIYINSEINLLGNTFASSFEKKMNCNTQSIEFKFHVDAEIRPDSQPGNVSYEQPNEAIVSSSSVLLKDDASEYYYPIAYKNTLFDNDFVGFLGDISAPNQDYFTINSEHTNIDQYFTGYLLGYQIISDISLGDYFFFIDTNTDAEIDEKGLLQVNPNRNKIIARVLLGKREISNTVVNINNGDRTTWRDKKPIIFSKQKSDYIVSTSYDYIFTNYVCTNDITYKNKLYLTDGKYTTGGNNVKGFSGSPIQNLISADDSVKTKGFWSDLTLEKYEQADGSYIGVINTVELNKISDLLSGATKAKWNDDGDYGFYSEEESIDINKIENHSGRQDFTNLNFNFNIVFGNYDINRLNQKDIEIIANCILKEEMV